MKKILAAAAFAMLSVVPSMAQNSIVNNPDNKAYFGIRAAGEITCPGDVTTDHVGMSVYKNGGGFELGGIYNIPVVANFYVEPGLKFYYNTYSVKDEILDLVSDELDLNSISVRKFGMRIPVMAGYHFDFTDDIKVSVFTGPELEVGFTAKAHAKGDGFSESESFYGKDGNMNRVDLLWGIGAGISYQRYYFGVSGSIGMLNMFDDSDVKFHENRVSFSLGYNF